MHDLQTGGSESARAALVEAGPAAKCLSAQRLTQAILRSRATLYKMFWL